MCGDFREAEPKGGNRARAEHHECPARKCALDNDRTKHEAEDLEVETMLCYELVSKKWLGQFAAGAIRDVPAKKRNIGPLLCYSCRKDVTEKFPHFWSHIPMVCPSCGLSLMIPIEPPEGLTSR